MSKAQNSSRKKIRVLIADADCMGGQLMASALARCRNKFEIVGVAGNLLDVVRQVELSKPDVVLLNTGPQVQSGLAVLEAMRASGTSTAVVILLHSPDRDTVIEAFWGGVRGIISRSDSFEELAKCIRCVHNGQIWANNSQIEYLLEAFVHLKPRLSKSGGIALLTPREQQVTQLVSEGMKNREIAHALQVGEHTVSNYLYRIFEKLGVSSRVELILYALSRGPQHQAPASRAHPADTLAKSA